MKTSKLVVFKYDEYWAVKIIATLYFFTCYLIAVLLYNKGVFYQYDMFFDADVPSNLKSIAHGFSEGRNTYTHPFLEFLSIPVYGIQKVITLFVDSIDPRNLRELIAIGYAPLLSSISAILFYKIIKIININNALLITLIYTFSFSNIIFSLIVETYSISAFIISLLIYYFVSDNNNTINSKTWFILGILLTGITITNLAIFYIIYACYLYKKEHNFLYIIKNTTLISFTILAFVLSWFFIVQKVFSITPAEFEGGKVWLGSALKFSYNEIISNSVNLLASTFNSFFGVDVNIQERASCISDFCNKLSFVRLKSDYAFILLSLVFYAFIFTMFLKNYSKKNDKLYILLLLIVLYNFSFHSFFGREMFLYSQHWFIAFSLLTLITLSNYSRILISFLVLEIIFIVNFYYIVVDNFY